MTLQADGIYMPALIKRFRLVEEAGDLMNIPGMVQAIAFVKVNIILLNNDKLILTPFKGRVCQFDDDDGEKVWS